MPAPKDGRLRADSLARPENFWALVCVQGPDDCWVWNGTRNREGYGLAANQNAHRVSWTLTHGAIPNGLCVLHRCDNPPCVNPSHLFLGTRQVNNQDRDRKGRGIRGNKVWTCKLTPEQVQEIRARYVAGNETHRSLAQAYGVDHTVIGDVLRGQRWQHVPTPPDL